MDKKTKITYKSDLGEILFSVSSPFWVSEIKGASGLPVDVAVSAGYKQQGGSISSQTVKRRTLTINGSILRSVAVNRRKMLDVVAPLHKGTLTVENGQMTIHISLPSKSILNLFCGTAEDARKDGAALLQPTTDTVTYSDGLSEEVNGFDIPVPALDEEFDVAIIGTKGKWYDHKVSVTNAVLKEDDAAAPAETLTDGTYTIAVTLEGGSGKANIQSPCTLTVADGKMTATIVWSSSHYDYMLVDGERCDVLSTENGSMFEIPVAALDTPLAVVGDTTAMSTPHEIDYTLTFDASSAEVNG